LSANCVVLEETAQLWALPDPAADRSADEPDPLEPELAELVAALPAAVEDAAVGDAELEPAPHAASISVPE